MKKVHTSQSTRSQAAVAEKSRDRLRIMGLLSVTHW